jgi:hypothetical protein
MIGELYFCQAFNLRWISNEGLLFVFASNPFVKKLAYLTE